MTAVDASPLTIKICRLRGVRKARVVPITRLRFPRNSFDTILTLGANFGLFANVSRARWLLRRFHRMTSTDARIIAESLDPYGTDEPFHLRYHAQNRKRGRMPGQVRIRVRWKKYKGPWLDDLFVSPDEMRDILRGTGWHVARILASRGATYIAIIEKEGGSESDRGR